MPMAQHLSYWAVHRVHCSLSDPAPSLLALQLRVHSEGAATMGASSESVAMHLQVLLQVLCHQLLGPGVQPLPAPLACPLHPLHLPLQLLARTFQTHPLGSLLPTPSSRARWTETPLHATWHHPLVCLLTFCRQAAVPCSCLSTLAAWRVLLALQGLLHPAWCQTLQLLPLGSCTQQERLHLDLQPQLLQLL
jgi:hypothetical protein